LPKKIPPTGRKKKVTAKIPNVPSKAAVRFPSGKKRVAMMVAAYA
jgi:hypothetical protein